MTITYQDILDLYGTLNDLGVPDGLSGDRRTLSTTDAISSVLERAFTPDVLDGKGLFNGIVMATLPTTQPTFLSFKDNINYLNSIAQNPDGELQELHFIYKVYIPEIDPREIILNTDKKKACGGLSLSQRVTTLPTAVIGSGISEDKSQQAIVPGTLVDIRFSDAKRFLRPIIVGISGKVFDIDYTQEKIGVTFADGIPTQVLDTSASRVSSNAKSFFYDLRNSSHLSEYSDIFLMGLVANAQRESGFNAAANGDKRDDVGGNGEYAIKVGNTYYCSFGLWQLNVCANGGGGQRFAKYHNIQLTDSAALYSAITDKEKQYEFIANDSVIKNLYKDNEGLVEDAGEWAALIAVKFERCRECKPLNDKSGKYKSTLARVKIARGLEEELGTVASEQNYTPAAPPVGTTPTEVSSPDEDAFDTEDSTDPLDEEWLQLP
tara:strand:- start:3397 stop:4701 length:1305 start_codon:yes stop_codon:yes gene_type:complete